MVRVADKVDLNVHLAERDQGGSVKDWNVIGLTDMGGRVVERYVLSPYGELTVHQETGFGDYDGDGDVDATDLDAFDSLPSGLAEHPGRIASAVDQPFGHQGLLFDAEIGSYQNRMRQYDPGMRRFLQRDPFAFLILKFQVETHYVNGMNQYAYVDGSPASNLDPSGLGELFWTKGALQMGVPHG